MTDADTIGGEPEDVFVKDDCVWPPDCCGHSIGAHECGLCQIVIHDGTPEFGVPPVFCPCPLNDAAEREQ